MKGQTLAVIVPFSNQFRRDLAALYDAIVERLPGALGLKIDQTIVGTSAPGTGFEVLGTCTAQSLIASGSHTAYKGLVNAYTDIADHGGAMNGIALSPAAEGILLGSVDTTGRPTTPGTPAIVGIAGDWTQAVYGVVEDDVQISITDAATITVGSDQINLWERNMFAVRAEIEVGFVADANCFNLLTGAIPES